MLNDPRVKEFLRQLKEKDKNASDTNPSLPKDGKDPEPEVPLKSDEGVLLDAPKPLAMYEVDGNVAGSSVLE